MPFHSITHVLAFALFFPVFVVFGPTRPPCSVSNRRERTAQEGDAIPRKRRWLRLRHILVACEVALALVVLSDAGLMIKGAAQLLGVDPGLDPKNVLTMQMSVPQEAIYVGPRNAALLPRSFRSR